MQVLPIGSLLLYAHSQPRLTPRRALHIPQSTLASWLAIALSSFRKLHLESEMRVTCSLLNCSRLLGAGDCNRRPRARARTRAPNGAKNKMSGNERAHPKAQEKLSNNTYVHKDGYRK